MHKQPDLFVSSDINESDLVLWAESPEEARNFLGIWNSSKMHFEISRIFVAKRSGKSRSNSYLHGQYYATTNDRYVDVYEDVVITASPQIIGLVEWCTCDIMLSWGNNPIVAIEITTHIVRMNLYQRIPRLAKAAMNGVPSIALQGTRGLNFEMRGDRWALYRYLKTFIAMEKLYPDTPPLPIYYLPDANEEEKAQQTTLQYINHLLIKDSASIKGLSEKIIQEANETLENGMFGKQEIPPDIPSIEHSGDEVIVHIGAKPDKPSWRTKGSGQMDPYIGMIVAAKYLYCYDSHGNQVKPLIVKFTYLPKGFFFFENWETSNSLYKTLAFKIADKVEFCG